MSVEFIYEEKMLEKWVISGVECCSRARSATHAGLEAGGRCYSTTALRVDIEIDCAVRGQRSSSHLCDRQLRDGMVWWWWLSSVEGWLGETKCSPARMPSRGALLPIRGVYAVTRGWQL